jgi:hypothetical protein
MTTTSVAGADAVAGMELVAGTDSEAGTAPVAGMETTGAVSDGRLAALS